MEEMEGTEAPVQMTLEPEGGPVVVEDGQLKAVMEAIVYVAEEPVAAAQIASALGQPEERVKRLLEELVAEFAASAHGVMIREVAGGFKMTPSR